MSSTRTTNCGRGCSAGPGGTFSSGMDLKAFLKGESPSFPGRGLCGITQTPPRKPLIGAAEGWALAGGFELLLACDLVVAGASARFGVPEVKRSLVAGAGGALLLAQRVPRALALELLLTGDPIDARRAAEIGLVNRVVEEGQALAAALELAEKIAANGPLALMATKEIAHRGGDWTAAERWDRGGQADAAGLHLAGRARRRPGVRREARSGLEGKVSVHRDLYEPDHEAFREVVQAYVKREVTPNSQRWEQEHSSTGRPGSRRASRPSSGCRYRRGSAGPGRMTSATAAW